MNRHPAYYRGIANAKVKNMSRDLNAELLALLDKRVMMIADHRKYLAAEEYDVAYVVQLRINFNDECLAALHRDFALRAETQVVKALQVFPVM